MVVNNFIQELTDRGFEINSTHDFSKLGVDFKRAYLGFDLTADSLHVGSLKVLMMMQIFQKHGGQPVILLGSGTTLVGDPSGKDKARPVLTSEVISNNKKGIIKIIKKILDFNVVNAPIIVDNFDWLKDINYLEFLRDFGYLFSVNKMLTQDSVKLRLGREQPLSFLEFNYMLLQAYDFYILSRDYDCFLQLAGSDQWGNIITGCDLIRKLTKNTGSGITCSLLTNSAGQKMGKTADGAIWLDAEKLSSIDLWQYWRSISDSDVEKFVNLFVPEIAEEIRHLDCINKKKKVLATAMVELCHGTESSIEALKSAESIYENNSIEHLFHLQISEVDIKNGYSVVLAIKNANMANSLSAARRLILGGAIKLNDKKVYEVDTLIEISNFSQSKLKIAVGKKKSFVVELIG